ncbi:MAG: DUF4350 domain-containing protein [Methanoregula sp.]|nr:DUF4350 domain-containing protein [Methanoregula sp.]
MILIRTAFWIAGILLLLSALILATHLSTNSLEFSRYNTGWNGTSQFFSDLDRHQSAGIFTTSDLALYPKNATLLIIAPERIPTKSELDGYRAFVERGNRIILADDFGQGNEILQGIGSQIIIMSGNLSSVDREYANSYSVVVYPATIETRFFIPPKLMLNRPAALDGGTPLMQTSILSWIDINGDRRLNSQESVGIYPVLSFERIGNGELIVLSDPSIFINAMYSQDTHDNNRDFIQRLVEQNRPVLIDQMNSRTQDAEGVNQILHVIRTNVIVEIVIFAVLLLVAAGAWRKKRI